MWQSLKSSWQGQLLNKHTRGVEKNQAPSDVQKMTSNQRQNYPVRTQTLQLHQLAQDAPAAGAQGDMAHCIYLLQKTRLVGDNGSLKREFEATFDVLGCWDSHGEFSKHVNKSFDLPYKPIRK